MTTDREALDAIQLLIEDVENKYGDPHTLRHAKAALAALTAQGGGQGGKLCQSCAEEAARICERRAESRWEEFGISEPDTNASYYPSSIENEMTIRDEEDSDCAAAIRLAAAKEGKK